MKVKNDLVLKLSKKLLCNWFKELPTILTISWNCCGRFTLEKINEHFKILNLCLQLVDLRKEIVKSITNKSKISLLIHWLLCVDIFWKGKSKKNHIPTTFFPTLFFTVCFPFCGKSSSLCRIMRILFLDCDTHPIGLLKCWKRMEMKNKLITFFFA